MIIIIIIYYYCYCYYYYYYYYYYYRRRLGELRSSELCRGPELPPPNPTTQSPV